MELYLEGLDCPNCAEKIRAAAEKHKSVQKAEMNFMSKTLNLEIKDGENESEAFKELCKIIVSIEPEVVPAELTGKKQAGEFTLILEDLDCAECGEKIRSYAEKMNGVEKAELNFMAKKLRIVLSPTGRESAVEAAVTGFVNSVEPDVTVIKEKSGAPRRRSPEKEEPAISKRMLARLAVTAVLFALGMIFRNTNYGLFIFIAAYFIIGLDIFMKAFANIIKGQAFDECFLMTVASAGAFFIGEYPEGVAVMFLYQLGEMFQNYAVRRSRNSISELMDIRPDSAYVKRDGNTVMCSPDEVEIGETIVVKAGEKLPLDGVITSGSTSLDTSALTGESVPRIAECGDEVLSGCVNLSGLIEVRVTKEFGESTVSKILELVENSAAKKAKTENFITRFAKIYTPCVVGAAILLALIPMLIEGGYSSEWLYRALSFLVVSCPCALVISVPLSFFGGIGGASARGILVKGGNCFENLAKCNTIVFDKTGTLTSGTFGVTETLPAEGIDGEELIRLAAYAECTSNHPAARAVTSYYMAQYHGKIPGEISSEEIAGKGVKASFEEKGAAEASAATKEILAGNAKLMEEYGVDGIPEITSGGTVIYVAADRKYAGCIRISDTVKPDAAEAVAGLKKSGIHTVMLTGDRRESAEATAAQLGIDEFAAELLPEGKVERLEKILSAGGITAFVGDGINDAPVLMRADVGIAMGGIGSDAAIEAADVVLMTDEPSKINEAVKISRRTKAIVTQNIVFAIGVKLIILLLTALGITTMWIAVFGDVGVAMLAILNAMRARRFKA